MAENTQSIVGSSTPIGYPKLAEHIGNHPNLASFRRFAALNARNLLYFQAELIELEEELEKVEQRDHKLWQDGTGDDYTATWYWLGGKGGNDQNKDQLDLVRKLRELLYQYNEALIQQRTTMTFQEPNRTSLEELRFFNDEKLHSRILEVRAVWGSRMRPELQANDLIVLSESHEVDAFSKFVVEKVLPWLHQHIVRRFSKLVREENPLVEYNDHTWLRYTKSITTVIACLLPVLFISVLCSIHSLRSRLTAIACFNILSTICLDVFTTAKRVEIFAVTAAFAAVQVVFISSNGSNAP